MASHVWVCQILSFFPGSDQRFEGFCVILKLPRSAPPPTANGQRSNSQSLFSEAWTIYYFAQWATLTCGVSENQSISFGRHALAGAMV